MMDRTAAREHGTISERTILRLGQSSGVTVGIAAALCAHLHLVDNDFVIRATELAVFRLVHGVEYVSRGGSGGDLEQLLVVLQHLLVPAYMVDGRKRKEDRPRSQ